MTALIGCRYILARFERNGISRDRFIQLPSNRAHSVWGSQFLVAMASQLVGQGDMCSCLFSMYVHVQYMCSCLHVRTAGIMLGGARIDTSYCF